MKEASIVKIMSQSKEDVEAIAKALSQSFIVATTSPVIYDETKNKYHQFLSVS